MASKRSRLIRSSSSGDFNVVSSPFPPNKLRFPPVTRSFRPPLPPTSAENPPSIFTVGSPVPDLANAKYDVVLQFGGFLEKCGFCRKKISNDDEVFMYSTLRAFCNAECRDKQIARDMSIERMKAKSKLKLSLMRDYLETVPSRYNWEVSGSKLHNVAGAMQQELAEGKCHTDSLLKFWISDSCCWHSSMTYASVIVSYCSSSFADDIGKMSFRGHVSQSDWNNHAGVSLDLYA